MWRCQDPLAAMSAWPGAQRTSVVASWAKAQTVQAANARAIAKRERMVIAAQRGEGGYQCGAGAARGAWWDSKRLKGCLLAE